MNSHLTAAPLPVPIGRRDENAVEGGQCADDLATPALLEAIDAVERIALGFRLERSELRLRSAARFDRQLMPSAGVGDAPQIPCLDAALLGPLDRVPLQKVRGAMF